MHRFRSSHSQHFVHPVKDKPPYGSPCRHWNGLDDVGVSPLTTRLQQMGRLDLHAPVISSRRGEALERNLLEMGHWLTEWGNKSPIETGHGLTK